MPHHAMISSCGPEYNDFDKFIERPSIIFANTAHNGAQCAMSMRIVSLLQPENDSKMLKQYTIF